MFLLLVKVMPTISTVQTDILGAGGRGGELLLHF